MSTNATDLEQFGQFINDQLAQGVNLTPEDCLDLWRSSRPSHEELVESVAAVKRGLEQVQRGEGTPLDEFDRKFRAERGIPLEGE